MKRSFSQIQAIFFAIAGFSLWVLVDSSVKLAATASIPPQEVSGVIGFVGMTALLLKSQQHGGIRSLKPKKWRGQILSATFSLAINLLNVVALKHLPFILFFIIAFTAPMIIAIIAAGFLREHLTRGKIIAIIAGFCGVVIAVDPINNGGGNMHGDWIGYVSMATGVLCFSMNMVWQRHMTQSETPDSLAFFQAFVQTLVCGGLLLFSSVALTPRLLLILCGGGIINITANLCSMIASKHTTAATVAQFHYTQIIAGALIGYLIWHEIPTLPLITGSAIIIASGIYIANHTRKAKNVVPVKPL